MKMIIALSVFAVSFVTAINLAEIHPQCNYADCAPVTYEEQVDADLNIYKILIHPLLRVRTNVPVCDQADVKDFAYPKISEYFSDNGYAETLPYQISFQVNEPKPAECVDGSSSESEESDEDDLSFPCCPFNYTSQIVLRGDVTDPAEPDEDSGVYIVPWPYGTLPGDAYTIVFDDSSDHENVIEKWNQLKDFLVSIGLVPMPDGYFNFADFSLPGAPDTNRYWVLSGFRTMDQ